MSFIETVRRARDLLRDEGRISLRGLKREFSLDDEALEELVEELVDVQQVAAREGKVLSWVGVASAEPPGAVAETPEPARSQGAPEAERRQLTVLFCDLVDSTQLAAGMDAEDWREVVRTYQEAATSVVARFGGHVAQYLGDGLLVYFGYPSAHEDDAERAIRAGLGIAEAVASGNDAMEERHGVRLATRIGIHTGAVVVGEMGGGAARETLAMGETTNLAARLEGIAEPGSVLLSAATLRLVQGVFVTTDMGRHVLKGVGDVQAFQALRPSGMRSRLDVTAAVDLTPLIGREQELGLLGDRFAQVGEGWGQAVLIAGEAGIGKSRLVQAFRERLAERSHTWLECRASPYTQDSALYPVVDLLRQALNFRADEPDEDRLTRLETGLANAGLEPAAAMPVMARLLDLSLPASYPLPLLSPEGQRKRTLALLIEWLLRLGGFQPAVLLMEDLHWMDPSTLELLGGILEQIPRAQVLLLATHRPDFDPPWGARSHVTPMLLSRLTRAQLIDLVRKAPSGRDLPSPWVEEIARRSDGVPLFAEELTKTVVESNPEPPATGDVPELRIPETLQDALMARLDSLGPVKELAQLGSVLGREFSYDLLLKVSPMREESLQQALKDAVREELFYQRGTPPNATYLFKHALTRDVAYQSLLRSTRQSHHHRVAETLMDRLPQVASAQPEVVAHHLAEAGELERAIVWWQRAGEQANTRIAHEEAIRHLQHALALLEQIPDGLDRSERELDAQLQLGVALVATRGYADEMTRAAYERAERLCRTVQDAARRIPALHGLCTFFETSGDLDAAASHAAELLALGNDSRDPVPMLLAHSALQLVSYQRGRFEVALDHGRAAAAAQDASVSERLVSLFAADIGLNSRGWISWTQWALGWPDGARDEADEALELARVRGHPFTLAFQLAFACAVYQMRRDRTRCLALAEELVPLADTHGFPLWRGSGGFLAGWAVGDADTTRAGVMQAAGTGNQAVAPYILGHLADAVLAVDQPGEALGIVEGAQALAARFGMRFWDAELHRLQGETLLRLEGHTEDEAESLFLRALQISGSQEARSLELRAATSLARLWQTRGRRAEARDLLQPVYGWFTEGFDTQDLKDAKALLEELS